MPKKGATPGTLVISPRREVRLELDDDMKTGIDWWELSKDPEARLPLLRVFGEKSFRTPTPITLDRCFFTRDENRLTANVAVIGSKIPSGSPISFREVRFRLSHLSAWSQRKGFGFDRDAAGGLTVERLKLEWTRPPTCIARLPNRTQIEFASELNEGTRGPSRTTADLVEEADIRIAFPSQVELPELQRVVYRIRNFVALGVGHGVRMLGMSAYKTRPRLPRDFYFAHNELIYPLVEPDEDAEEPNPLRMPFLVDDAADRFDEHVNEWFRAADRLGPVMDIYFSILYARPTYPETRFLMYMQALEGYHRRTYDGAIWSDEEWAGVKSQLLDGVDEAYVAKLSGKKPEQRGNKLDPLNSVSLIGRLSELTRHCPLAAKRIFQAGRSSKSDFLEIAQATRNDQAHLFTEPFQRRAAKTVNDLRRVTEQAGALLNALLLVDAGFNDADIGEMLWRGGRIDSIRVWLAKPRPQGSFVCASQTALRASRTPSQARSLTPCVARFLDL
jgi:hypothetical protein